MQRPPQIVNIGWLGVQLLLSNGGSCFLPARMAAPFITSGQLFRVKNSPEFIHPAYMVYPRETDLAVMQQGLQLMRELV